MRVPVKEILLVFKSDPLALGVERRDRSRAIKAFSISTWTLQNLAEVEADDIRRILAAVGGNRPEAARVLGIDRKTLGE